MAAAASLTSAIRAIRRFEDRLGRLGIGYGTLDGLRQFHGDVFVEDFADGEGEMTSLVLLKKAWISARASEG